MMETDADFVRQLIDLADANEKKMDGTMEPVKRIVAGADVVFAVWEDPDELYSVGYLIVKGEKLAEDLGTNKKLRLDAIKCIEKEQAIALKRVI